MCYTSLMGKYPGQFFGQLMTTGARDDITAWTRCLAAVFVMQLILWPDLGLADGDGSPIGDVFCSVGLWLTTSVAKGMSTISVAATGIGAALGKVQWGAVLIVGVGVSVIFAAGAIVGLVYAGSPPATCDVNVIVGIYGGGGSQTGVYNPFGNSN